MAALALVIMCMGGLIPIATYVCPMLCILIQYVVFHFCGKRIAWTWYVTVAVLSMLIGPDKEGTAVFLVLGYYPILKPVFEKWPFSWAFKLLLFNGAVALLYTVLLSVLGVENTSDEFFVFGIGALILLLVLGNLTFVILDKLLSIIGKKFRKR